MLPRLPFEFKLLYTAVATATGGGLYLGYNKLFNDFTLKNRNNSSLLSQNQFNYEQTITDSVDITQAYGTYDPFRNTRWIKRH